MISYCDHITSSLSEIENIETHSIDTTVLATMIHACTKIDVDELKIVRPLLLSLVSRNFANRSMTDSGMIDPIVAKKLGYKKHKEW